MQLSERGYRKIKAYEGYGKQLPDGRCEAYREKINGKLDIPTIGYGCTKGILMGTVWTLEQAEEALRTEIATHEARVTKLSTVDLNQNEFDALVSFDFNCGGLTDKRGQPTRLLKALNRNDRPGVVTEMKLWNQFGGKPAKALIARRADEAALFLEPVEPAQPNTMPQQVEQAAAPVTPFQAAVVASSTVGGLSQIPSPPDLSVLTNWQATGETLASFASFVASNPVTVAGIVVVTGLLMLVPKGETT